MTQHPFDPTELDRIDADLDETAFRLERYASTTDAAAPPDLVARITAAIEAEPTPAAGWWTSFSGALVAWRRPAAVLAAAAVMVAIAVTAVAVGDLFEQLRNVGASPVPSVTLTPSPSPTPSATPSPTPTPSVTPSPSPSPIASPTATDDDDDLETPDPSDDDGFSDDDSSGPGGGDD
jgi:hypothetical protein